jgi:uncharacterized protein (TIGR02246 family)
MKVAMLSRWVMPGRDDHCRSAWCIAKSSRPLGANQATVLGERKTSARQSTVLLPRWLQSTRKEVIVQSSPKVMSAALALSIVLLSPASNAFVEPKEEVAQTTMAWGRALGEDDPDKVLPLYSEDAVLWGTLSPTVRADRAALRDYFVTAFKVLPSLKVTFGDQLIRVYDGTAVNTGYYTFSYVKDGETKSLPARYSFTYVKRGDAWLIVDHHSSAMPSAPK